MSSEEAKPQGKAESELHFDDILAMPGKYKSTNPLVISSLKSALTVVLPEASSSLQQRTGRSKSEPTSPDTRKGLFKHFPRSTSPVLRKKHRKSDPDASNGQSRRPNWLNFKHKKKSSRSSEEMNGGTTPLGESMENLYLEATSGSSLEPEATPMATLPGQKDRRWDVSCTEIPTIMVSHTGDDNFEDQNGSDSDAAVRKMSQSSRHSQCSSTLLSGTSGVGSLLSPSSGDECDPCSDLESPLSNLSGASSFTDETPGVISDCDPIERDFGGLASPSSDQESVDITPTGSRDNSPPELGAFGDSPRKVKIKKMRHHGKQWERWERVKKVVQAWSPFAVQFKKKKYPWVQLAGHQGNFAPGSENGTIMKKSDQNERTALMALMDDVLKPYVPEFKRMVEKDEEMYVEMTDLLRDFDDPAVMDIKMGIRTYLEEELLKARVHKALRKDMYDKMTDVDPNEPTEEEHAQQAISKPRYMQWRESVSSSSTLGFRIEGIKTTSGEALKDFKTTKAPKDVSAALKLYISENPTVKEPMLRRLKEIRASLERSEFFHTHEVIGSSLLFVYDSSNQNSVHMIDFGKTTQVPPGIRVDHRTTWEEGNHEDGYLWGLDNLISMWQDL